MANHIHTLATQDASLSDLVQIAIQVSESKVRLQVMSVPPPLVLSPWRRAAEPRRVGLRTDRSHCGSRYLGSQTGHTCFR